MNTINETATKTGETDENFIDFVELPDGYRIYIVLLKKEVLYVFRDSKGNETAKYNGKEPLTITELSTIGKEIKKHLDPHKEHSTLKLSKMFEDCRVIMHNIYDTIVLEKMATDERAKQEKEEYVKLKLEEAKKVLETTELPLIYISSLVSWMTAGEKMNIMLEFLAYCSQVILGIPISVIGLGEGGSGKTHIQTVALDLIPSEYIRHEKGVTAAAMFNRAKDNVYYYDGCVVNYGDLGGQNSQEFIMEAKNLLKELQSDGFVNKPLNIPGPEGWTVIDIVLYGRPALTYTTIPGFIFDDQEMSRSIFITPRMDNKAVFNARKTIMELKHGKSYKQYMAYKEEIKLVKYMVKLIKERVKDIVIINPYTGYIIDYLGESEYFKRDFDKYNGLLKTITAFHVFTRPTLDLNGNKVLFTTLNDIQLFTSLLHTYHESISVNISPKAAEILQDLRKNLKVWKANDRLESLLGITTTEYDEISSVILTKRSIRRYFGELNNAGFIKVRGKLGSANVYDLSLSGEYESNLSDGKAVLTPDQAKLIEDELGHEALEFIMNDHIIPELSFKTHYDGILKPEWDKYDR
jgi:hypothetical protein